MKPLLLFAAAAAFALESGAPIPVGAPDRIGPLAPGLSAYPVGAVKVYGGARPDLFVVAGKFSFPPGLFLYRWKADGPGGRPIFGDRVAVRQPSAEESPECFIWQDAGGIQGLFLEKRELIHALYDADARRFVQKGRISLGTLPRTPTAFAALPNPDGSVELVFHVADGTPSRPPDFDWRDPRYVPFDGAGIWRGGLPHLALYASTRANLAAGALGPARMVSGARDVLLANRGLTVVNLGPGRGRDIVSGSRFGDLYYYRNRAAAGVEFESRRHVTGAAGNALRHPTINPTPLAYPDPRSGLSNLLAAGEGAVYWYRFTGRFTQDGRPVYDPPVPALEQNALLYSGSLGVPTQVDWDGDGVVDLVVGNSEGRILWMRNVGSNAQPAFAPGVPLQAGGRQIEVQPGYKGDIQGPGEARWGYISPNVVDWNGDGLPDILFGDSLSRHMILLNRGTRRAAKLDAESPLYLDGLDLHGSWRVRPGVASLGGRMAYVANDDQDEFHLYWRVDDYNVADGGKLRMESGIPIRANFLAAGGTGRSKLELADFDGDGVVDLLVGTPKHHSVPEPNKGLPKALGLPGASVLFLKNVGTNAEPRFRFPAVLRHDGRPIHLGNHEIGVATGPLGVVVSREDGHLMYYRRDRITW
jgi:hypothetical protein